MFMEKSMVWQRRFEQQGEELFTVSYWLCSQGMDSNAFYGVGVEKRQGGLVVEAECVEGLSESKGEVEAFLHHLWLGESLPVELISLCDDFISGKEYAQDFSVAC